MPGCPSILGCPAAALGPPTAQPSDGGFPSRTRWRAGPRRSSIWGAEATYGAGRPWLRDLQRPGTPRRRILAWHSLPHGCGGRLERVVPSASRAGVGRLPEVSSAPPPLGRILRGHPPRSDFQAAGRQGSDRAGECHTRRTAAANRRSNSHPPRPTAPMPPSTSKH